MGEKECCGNGCNSCVLDGKGAKSTQTDYTNVINHNYSRFKLSSVEKCTDFVYQLAFTFCGEKTSDARLVIPPGAHLMMRLKGGLRNQPVGSSFKEIDTKTFRKESNQKPTTPEIHDPNLKIGDYLSRPYTPIAHDMVGLSFQILFRYERGEMSNLIIRLSLGDAVEWKGCYGDFKWSRNKSRNLICISQGIGIAPLLTLVRSIVLDEEDETRIHLISCFKSFEDVVLKDELVELQRFWNLSLSLFLPYFKCKCKESDHNCTCIIKNLLFKETVHLCKINIESLRLLFDPKESFILVSGSTSFIDQIKEYLTIYNVTSSKIHTF